MIFATNNDQGPISIYIKYINKAENELNEIIQKSKVPIEEMNFKNPDIPCFNEHFNITYQSIDKLITNDRNMLIIANRLKEDLEEYIDKIMMPEILQLEIFVLLR